MKFSQMIPDIFPGLIIVALHLAPVTSARAAPAPALARECTPQKLSRTVWCTNITGGFVIDDGRNSLIWNGEDFIKTNASSQKVTQTYKFAATVATGFYSRGAYFQVHAECGVRCTATVEPKRVHIRLGHVETVTVTYINKDMDPTTHRPAITLYEEGMSPLPIRRVSAPYRCDSSLRRRRPGCVIPGFVSTEYAMSRLPNISKNIAQGQAKPMHYGRIGTSNPLHYDPEKTVANRAIACPSNRPKIQDKSCDEYPFASTSEGGAVSCPHNCSVMDVPAKENLSQGGTWTQFLRKNRILPPTSASAPGAGQIGDAAFIYVADSD